MSLNELVEEWASMALAQFDAETRFIALAARGNAQRALTLIDKLDRSSARGAGRRPSGTKWED
jgi:hypothetical protein